MNIAVIIPCFNEEITIQKVVLDFRNELPDAEIYVFDNNSTDRTREKAAESGAIVLSEKPQGKGNVVRSMFRKVDADIYVMVDGDDTYPARLVHQLIEPVVNNECDMTVGSRMRYFRNNSFRSFHMFGNKLVRYIINKLFGCELQDILSGYRCFSKNLVKSIPILSNGFEVETELTLQCLHKRFHIIEKEIEYGERPEGSYSKLNTFGDGLLVLRTIFKIFKDYKPLSFFGILSLFGFIVGLATGGVVVHEYLLTSYITRVPLAIFSVGCVLTSLICFNIGLILDSISRRFEEIFEITAKQQNGLKSKDE